MATIVRSSLIWLMAIGISQPVAAASGNDLRSLDGQVQEIKSDVLEIASDLGNLEERLLYPTGTQIAVFVSLADKSDNDFRLDAVHLQLDGEAVTHHIYRFEELEALGKGGVQRLFTGNVATGKHELVVTMTGQTRGGDDFDVSQSFPFEKRVEPVALGITLSEPGGTDPVSIGAW